MTHMMTSVGVALTLLLAAGSVGVGQYATKSNLKEERQRLLGKWDTLSAKHDNEVQPVAKGSQLVFDAETWSVLHDGKQVLSGTYAIDSTVQPNALDITITEGSSKGTSLLAIYELRDNQLQIARAEPNKERPADFNAKGTTVSVYQRAKP